MVASNRTVVSSLNVAIPGVTLTENLQHAALLVHTTLKAAGWTVITSSNGVVANASDNIATIADVVSAAPGVAHSWVRYQAPAALGNWQLVMDCNDPDATKREVDFFGAPSYNTNGTITNRPTPVVGGNEWSRINIDLIPSGTFVAMSSHVIRFSDGEVFIGLSVNGTGFMETILWIPALKGGDDPLGVYPYAFYYNHNASGASQTSQITSTTNWRTNHTDGSAITSIGIETPANSMSLWTSALSTASNRPAICPVDFVQSAAATARYVGRSEDIRFGGNLLPVNTVEDGDLDAIRRVGIRGMWLVVQSAQLPINL